MILQPMFVKNTKMFKMMSGERNTNRIKQKGRIQTPSFFIQHLKPHPLPPSLIGEGENKIILPH